MSSFTHEIIKCPNCQQEGTYMVWQSINVDLNPEQKQKVMDGSIFHWQCPHCGKQYNVPYPLLYHDMTNHFMVQYNPNNPYVLFIEYIKIREHGLNNVVINKLEIEYQKYNDRENILFDDVSDNGDLIFTVYCMPKKFWEVTNRQHIISRQEYDDMVSNDSQREKEVSQTLHDNIGNIIDY